MMTSQTRHCRRSSVLERVVEGARLCEVGLEEAVLAQLGHGKSEQHTQARMTQTTNHSGSRSSDPGHSPDGHGPATMQTTVAHTQRLVTMHRTLPATEWVADGAASLPGTAASHSGSDICSRWVPMSHLVMKMRSHLLLLSRVATRLHTGALSSLHGNRAITFSSSSLEQGRHSLMPMTPLPLAPELPAFTDPLPDRMLFTQVQLEQLPKGVFPAQAPAACLGQDVVHTALATSSLTTPLQGSPPSPQVLMGQILLGLPIITTATTCLLTLPWTSCSRLSCCSPTLLTHSPHLRGTLVEVGRGCRVHTPWTPVFLRSSAWDRQHFTEPGLVQSKAGRFLVCKLPRTSGLQRC